MTGPSRNLKIFLVLSALAGAVAISISFAYPTPVESPTLGTEWQCHKAGIMTSCRRVGHAEPTAHRLPTHLGDMRWV